MVDARISSIIVSFQGERGKRRDAVLYLHTEFTRCPSFRFGGKDVLSIILSLTHNTSSPRDSA